MKELFAAGNTGSCPLPISKYNTVQLGHGSGGKMMNDLISNLFIRIFDNPALNQMNDQAELQVNGSRLAFSTDSFVVDPLFFPGGDIGDLAVNGTVNDVAMSGAKPLFLSTGFIIEEGFSLGDLEKIVESMQRAACKAGIAIVTGDTKVVNKGSADKIFINTAGIGLIEHDFTLGAKKIQPSDAIILSGTIADHGITILSQREGLAFEAPVESDTAALHELIAKILAAGGAAVRAMRDPTRGGLASALNEYAEVANVGIRIAEERIPLNKAVAGACEMLGIDPLHVANEGKLITIVAREKAGAVLAAMRKHPLGEKAAIIGDTTKDDPGLVTLRTKFNTWRIVDMLVGEQLPRIC